MSRCIRSLLMAFTVTLIFDARAQGQSQDRDQGDAALKRNASPRRETITVRARMGSGTAAQYSKNTAVLGPLGNRPVTDTPFSIMTVTHDVIVNQQVRNINDLAQFLPSVQLEERGDPNTSRPQSRGFEADVVSNSRMDGLNMVITTPYAAERFEDLQVLNGLAGALYGPQNPAGTFSFTLKRPTDRRTERFTAGVDSIGAPMEALDVSGRVGRHGWFGYRSTCSTSRVKAMSRARICAAIS